MEPDTTPLTYPCPTIAIIALSEVKRRHEQEWAEVVQAALAASDLPADALVTLDVAKGAWVVQPKEA